MDSDRHLNLYDLASELTLCISLLYSSGIVVVCLRTSTSRPRHVGRVSNQILDIASCIPFVYRSSLYNTSCSTPPSPSCKKTKKKYAAMELKECRRRAVAAATTPQEWQHNHHHTWFSGRNENITSTFSSYIAAVPLNQSRLCLLHRHHRLRHHRRLIHANIHKN